MTGVAQRAVRDAYDSLGSPPPAPGASSTDEVASGPAAWTPNGHARCLVVSSLLRGALCEQLAGGPARHVDAGHRLYHIGGDAQSVFVVRRGLVKTSLLSPRGQELTLRLYREGEIFGELCLCTGERREQAIALEPTDVVEIPLEQLTARLLQDRRAALEFSTLLCRRLAESAERLRSLASDPVLVRLVRALLSLATELGEPSARGTRITHHFPQEELASLVGARREVVSGLMNRLRASGVIGYSRRGLIVVDQQRLAQLRDSLDDDTLGGNPLLAR